jgi:hypothetical protein
VRPRVQSPVLGVGRKRDKKKEKRTTYKERMAKYTSSLFFTLNFFIAAA